MTQSVDGAVAGLHHHLGTSVTVEVVDHELCVVCSCPDVTPQVDAPQAASVEFVAVEQDVACIAVVCIVVCVRGVPLQDDLVFAIAIHIAYRAVVGAVAVAAIVGCGAALGHAERDGEVAAWCVGFQCEGAVLAVGLLSTVYGAHLISGIAIGIACHGQVCGADDGFLVQPTAVFIYIECRCHGIFVEVSPRQNGAVAAFGAYCHQSAVQVFALDVGIVVVGLGMAKASPTPSNGGEAHGKS